MIPYLILDLQAFLDKVAGSVEIALKMNLCKFSMLISVTENATHFLIQNCLSPLLLQHDVAGRKKRRQDYTLNAFEKLAFCFYISLVFVSV